jgi:hypothetical protein
MTPTGAKKKGKYAVRSSQSGIFMKNILSAHCELRTAVNPAVPPDSCRTLPPSLPPARLPLVSPKR